MIKFLLKELISSLFSVFIFLFLMFNAINLFIPGDFLTPLRLMMSQQELEALRESLGANDPLYQQYFRWIVSVLSGELTPGGFRRNASRDITTTILPTLQILIPSFIFSYYIARIPSFKKSLKKLHQNRIILDTVSTLLISLFPPITYFLINDKLEELYFKANSTVSFSTIPESSLEINNFLFNFYLLLFLLTLFLVFTFVIELITFTQISKYKLLITLLLSMTIYLNLEIEYIYQLFFESKVAVKTIVVLSVFLLGEFIIMNNVIVQNIAREPHILTSRAIGYSNSKIFKNQILRNSFGPFAYRTAMNIPFLIASLVIVESTTGWGGMGSLLYRTIMNQDSNAAMGILFLLALLAIFFRISISIIHRFIDPRVNSNV